MNILGNADKVQVLIAIIGYIALVIAIGLYYAKKANQNSANYFLGGRSLGPWVAAMSAEASDMSGWLLMGLPGVAYWCGLADATWTAIGLAVGTYLNWLIISKRLRRYSVVAGNAITLPEFFSNRFKEKKKIILTVSALFILVFFTVYAASCFVTFGKLFSTVFNLPYQWMMILGALFVIIYTVIGGFLAESASDFMQALVMIFALTVIVVVGTVSAGGIGKIIENAKTIPGFFDFFALATPQVVDGTQIAQAGKPLFGAAAPYGWLTVISTLSWGLGYFGMPQVLLRFMAIRKEKELGKSRRIAITWCVISLFAAIAVGIIGRTSPLFAADPMLATASGAENIFVLMSEKLLPPLLAGIVMAGIIAAAVSSSDSYLLIASSSISKNIYQGIIKKTAKDSEVMLVSRITLIVIMLIGVAIAWNPDSKIFGIVSFAWAGFGATFGPLVIFSLFWKRINIPGAIAGMVVGGGMVFVWKLLIRTTSHGILANIYELLPAFILSCLAIVVVSLLTKKPSAQIEAEFNLAKSGTSIE